MTGTILVIDDEPDLRLLARIALEQGGYRVLEAGTGEDGLALIESSQPDLVLLDLRLPGMQGWEVLDRLRKSERWRDLPVVVVSAHASGHTLKEAKDQGSDDYLVKPFQRERLLAIAAKYAGNQAS